MTAPAVSARSARWIALLFLGFGPGCYDRPKAEGPPQRTLAPREAEASAAIRDGLSAIINRTTIRFQPLVYDYDEDLLTTLDKTEAHLSGRSKGPVPRAMPKLEEAEELDHFRETFRRWATKTGKDLRAEIDRFQAEVAGRKPGGPAFYPDFHKRFAVVFDDLIGLEVAEIRERRNRAIHEQAAPLLDRYRVEFPVVVRENEAILDQPPYNHPPREDRADNSKPGASTP